ncbi:MAG TPA: hypothetical protein VG267_14500 [Terracidiphilus sp.]|nr:hypothetical protein [Terracidiphilus sp.]
MMKNTIYGIMAFSVLTSAWAVGAQTPAPAPAQPVAPTSAAAPTPSADEIVGKYIDAIGGKAAIGQVKSISTDVSAQVMGNEVAGTTVIVDGVGYRSDMDFNGTKIIQSYNDKGGWQVNPMAGGSDPAPVSDDEYKMAKDQIYIGGPLFDYAAKGNKVQLVSSDADTYKVKVTTKDNVDTTYTFDPKTYLLKTTIRKGQMQGQDVDITTTYSDYRKTDVGYLMPYAMDLDFGGQFQLSIAIKKVELNKTIDPAIFEMPKPAAAAPAAAAPAATKPN